MVLLNFDSYFERRARVLARVALNRRFLQLEEAFRLVLVLVGDSRLDRDSV